MVNGVSSRELRVSDAEREHVIGLLQKAIGMGLLTLEEFTDRTDVALSSRTRAELNVVLADLPGMTHPEMRVRGGWGRPAADRPPLPGEPMVLTSGVGSSINRSGQWPVPRSMVIRSKWGAGVNLDFGEAVFEHERLDLRLEVVGGAVTLRVPAGGAVSVADLNTKMSSVNDRVGYQGHQGTPHIVISGYLNMAALTIKGPKR
ncbi:DUF1707 SHOCT-like domain-containing protein [Kutzneria sp. CA-103260]|uniref:DUF1707 SHOCT-like domain-containing protein n=1 Tax=Kutzneria sp. CA-103260 TaxID=2802641 RepID=UPI001BA52180|nr:DUF1707 domain-containing protein [Kutzneria sp. CA-103260]QUQ70786.1 hypothetical protein JJ691_85690 [Kutzneria sp. CA-103260]